MTIDQMFLGTLALIVALFPLVWGLRTNCCRGLLFLKKKVGPTYWGSYSGASTVDAPSEVIIALPEPSRFIEPSYGSSRYASGSAVKSARG